MPSVFFKSITSVNIWQIWLPDMVQYMVALKDKPLRTQPGLLLFKALIYLYLLCINIRIFIVTGAEHFNYNLTSYFYYDAPAQVFIESFSFYDATLALGFSATTLYGIFVDYAMYFGIERVSLDFFEDIIVHNGVNFFSLNPHLTTVPDTTSSIRRLIKLATSCRQIMAGTISAEKLKFEHHHLKYFPNISKVLRAQAVVRMYASAYSGVFSSLLSLLISFFCYCLLLYFILPGRPLLQQIAVIIDLQLLLYVNWNCHRLALIAIAMIKNPRFIYIAHMNNLNRRLARLITSYRQGKYSRTTMMTTYLSYFRGEHVQLVRNIFKLTGICSEWLFVAFVTQVPLNIWLVCSLIFKRLLLGERVVLLFLVIVMVYLGMVSCRVLIQLSEVLHSSGKLLYQSQMLLTLPANAFNPNLLDNIRSKLKLMQYYELVHTNRKICFSFGPLGKLTQKAVFEFLFFYSSYLMTASSMVMNMANK